MKYLFLFLGLLFFNNAFTQLEVFLIDPLEAIYPDSNSLKKVGGSWSADFPSNTVADVHVLVKTKIGTEFSISASMGDKELPQNYWHRLTAVPVEQNTGLDSRTEQFLNKKNPYVIRRAPFSIFEVIEPLENTSITTSQPYTALRLAIPPNAFNGPGKYQVKININEKEEAKFHFQIYSSNLPTLSESRFFYTNWFNLNRMEENHQVQRWTPDWYKMLHQYAQLMAHGRQNCVIIPRELIALKNEKVTLDEEKMLRFIDVFRQYGFQYFESPHLMYRGDGDDWGDPELKVVLTKRGYYTDEAKQDVAATIQLIKNFTQKNQLTHNWLQHIADEPTDVNARCYREVVKQVKSIYPEIKIMEATNNRDSIAGAVDLWCPLINDFQENEAFFRSREKLNEKVLVYTCLIPGGKWLNRTLDMEKLRQVYFGWGAAHYNTFGYLHWGLNQYKVDPFKQSVVHHPSPVASPNNFLPAGDTHVIYPGDNGPLSSIRFEAHRMGIEDYEMLEMLKSINPKRSKKLIDKLFQSYTEYNISLKDYRKVRKRLLKAL